MDEAEWLACADPRPMLDYLRGKASRRKLGLWVVACYRAVLRPEHRFREAVDVVERYAEGEASEVELEAMHQTYHTSLVLIRSPSDPCDFADFAASSILTQELQSLPSVLLRDIIGNPFRPVALDPAWRTPTVTALATAAYDDRILLSWNGSLVRTLAQAAYDDRLLSSGHLDPDRLLVLADALEEAGCDNADILSHLRGPGSHVRGCWVIDLLLGRS